jgi:hypothetical protein
MAAVEEETVVPTGPEHNHQDQDDAVAMSQDAEASQAHIYFKDLKLLAHDNGDSEDEEEQQPAQVKAYSPLADDIYDPGSSAATSPTADGTVRKKLDLIIIFYFDFSCFRY